MTAETGGATTEIWRQPSASGVGPAQVVDIAIDCFMSWCVIRLKDSFLGEKRIL